MSSLAAAKTSPPLRSKAFSCGTPALQEVAIVGLPHERWGEAPHAFDVLRQGAQTAGAELCEFARANLAHFKAPDSVTFVKELPKTATGKIQKYILRSRSTAIAPQ